MADAKPAPDAIDQAIASAEQTIRLPAPRIIEISSTKRHFAFSFPEDVTDAEIFEVVGWLSTGYRAEQTARRKARDPVARLWTPPAPPRPTA